MSADARGSFDPFATVVHLREDGRAVPVAWTPDVFRRLVAGDRDRVIGAKHGAEPADFHADEWEMHPRGDELLYLFTGRSSSTSRAASGASASGADRPASSRRGRGTGSSSASRAISCSSLPPTARGTGRSERPAPSHSDG